ncbi:MAG TPA: GspH/FimT family pseudopilin [Steroidobacteraceae bacterium]|nr:GspH/FimT family pseudopilin [Steroidobacteraceae bacterium]
MKSTSLPSFSAAKSAGFTLLELMFALAVAAVLIGLAAPNMRSFILNNRISSTANELLRSIQTARTEASKRQQSVVICFASNLTSPSCVKTNYTGWFIFEDSNKDLSYTSGEPVLEIHSFESDKIKILADNDDLVSYDSTGFRTVSSKNSTAMVVCDSRGNVDGSGGTTGASVARGIVINKTGHARITRTIDSTTDSYDISDLLTTYIGSSC